ncbi:MAG: succinylglutamate desuccinylase/aspartoacylase family protein [Oligoflexales bacterium]
MNDNRLDPDILTIDSTSIPRGTTQYFELNLARLYDFTELSMPVCVIRAKNPGPVFFISGAVHGDEIIGPEIIKRLLKNKNLRLTKGTLIIIPIVNVFGFNNKSRYLPDRRDLNRSFPGSQAGSLSSRLASIFLKEIIEQSHYGIDLHSGAVHRANLPQIRACLDNPVTESLALQFGCPVIVHSNIRDGSIREAAENSGVSMLLFEGGEALRHDEHVIKYAIRGILQCLQHVSMISLSKQESKPKKTFVARSSYWMRAPQSGVMHKTVRLGDSVDQKHVLCTISDTFAKNVTKVFAKSSGVVIGENRLPLVNQGDALFHIATFDQIDMDQFPEDLGDFSG